MFLTDKENIQLFQEIDEYCFIHSSVFILWNSISHRSIIGFFVQILLIPWVRWGMLIDAVCHAGLYLFKDNPTLNGIVKPFCSEVWCLI